MNWPIEEMGLGGPGLESFGNDTSDLFDVIDRRCDQINQWIQLFEIKITNGWIDLIDLVYCKKEVLAGLGPGHSGMKQMNYLV